MAENIDGVSGESNPTDPTNQSNDDGGSNSKSLHGETGDHPFRTICNYAVTLNMYDFGGAAFGLPDQPHFLINVKSPDGRGSFSSGSWKWRKQGMKKIELGSLHVVDKNQLRQEKDKIELLGKGNFGEVWKYETIKKGNVAVKKLKTLTTSSIAKQITSIFVEVIVMLTFSHRNLIEFLTLVDCRDDSLPWIVVEYAENGSLQRLLDKVTSHWKDYDELPPYWTFGLKYKIAFGIINGLEYLHCHQALHRDLTAGNVLLDKNFEPELADFGLSSFIDGGTELQMHLRNSGKDSSKIIYSFAYTAPEVFPSIQKKIVKVEGDPFKVLCCPSFGKSPQSIRILGETDDERNLGFHFETLEFLPPEGNERRIFKICEVEREIGGTYTFSSDIWSYGVLLQQIWTHGKHYPYYPTSVGQIKQVILLEKKNPCHFKPEISDKEIITLLKKTFKYNPKRRLCAGLIKKRLEKIIQKEFSMTRGKLIDLINL